MKSASLKEASFWRPLTDKKVNCELCPRQCKIGDGKTGFCRTRKNINGKLYTLSYGLASSIANDPIEKKPLYHFYPGSYVLSFGTYGCTLRCKHCQNYSISQTSPEDIKSSSMRNLLFGRKLEIHTPLELAEHEGSAGIAWTYNEPTVWYEFTYEASKLAKAKGLYTVYVTNGYINPKPLEKLSRYLDAMNLDVKAFTDRFYNNVSAGKLQPVLETAKLAFKLDIHIELTYLIIPGYNDTSDELRNFCNWVVKNLSPDIPVHFSRFHPDYKMLDVPATPVETLVTAYQVAKKSGLHYPYLGNIYYRDTGNTFCPNCNKVLVVRGWMAMETSKITKDGRCSACGIQIYGRYT